MQLTTFTSLTIRDIAEHGFIPAEIARLQALSYRYHPFREFCESDREFERLVFLKWRYGRGLLARELA